MKHEFQSKQHQTIILGNNYNTIFGYVNRVITHTVLQER